MATLSTKLAAAEQEVLDGVVWMAALIYMTRGDRQEWAARLGVKPSLQYAMVGGQMYLTVNYEELHLPGITFQAARV